MSQPTPCCTTALNAFGGWPGVAATLFVTLAFPICYALRTPQAHQKDQFRQQANQLRIASLLLVLSAALCVVLPADVYIIQPHIARDQQLLARAADWTVGWLIIYLVGPVLGFLRMRRVARFDQRSLETTIPDEQLKRHQTTSSHQPPSGAPKRPIAAHQANLFASQTCSLLTLIYITVVISTLLTTSLARFLPAAGSGTHWTHAPLYNILTHLSLLLSVLGLVQAFSHPWRTDMWEVALHCETPEARTAHWCWARRTCVRPGHAFRTFMCVRWRREGETQGGAESEGHASDELGLEEDEESARSLRVERYA